MNAYELTYTLPGCMVGGIHKEIVTGVASEIDARNILQAKFGRQEVRVISGRQTSFGGGRDERQDGRR